MIDFARLALPMLHRLDAEDAHRLTVKALRCGLGPRSRENPDPRLATSVFGLHFSTPIGLSAGFDKDAEVMGPMLDIGFGFVEVGSITPKPQPGNPRPRVFRLPDDRGVVNRLGFNNKGADVAAERLAAFRAGPAGRVALVGVNLGKNKMSEDAVADYALGASKLAAFADYLVVNVSSPNTPGLRALQNPDDLLALVGAVDDAARVAGVRPPILVKIAPDLEEADLRAVAEVARDDRVAGLIVSNTTVSRPTTLRDQMTANETGGLSGAPLFELSTRILSRMYALSEGRVPLIGVGGVSSGADAYAKIRAGASLVQLYTALVYEGPGLVARIGRDLAALLRRDGFSHVADAVGADHVVR